MSDPHEGSDWPEFAAWLCAAVGVVLVFTFFYRGGPGYAAGVSLGSVGLSWIVLRSAVLSALRRAARK